MGKGRIVSGGTDGSYTVELLHNRDRIDAEIAFLTAKLAELQEELDALETEREGMVAERNAIATDIDTAIANAEEGEIPDVEALLVELSQVSAKIQAQDVRIALVKGRMLESRKRKEMLEAVPADPQQQAWCADFTEDLTGDVGTVEVPAEGVVGQFATWRRVIVRPGHTGRATYSTARDGQMHHREGQVGYQAYFNAAILPGVQRHKPQYRIGTITAVDKGANTCSLTIQGEDSSAQSLIIDPPDLQYSKTGVPIEYMDCNAQPFEVGDRVLIEFQGRDWGSPKVIGFESNPRECAGAFRHFVIKVRRINSAQGSYESYAWSSSSCDPVIYEGDEWPGTTARYWHDTVSVEADATGITCEVDANVEGYLGSCTGGAAFATGEAHSIGALTGLGDSNPMQRFTETRGHVLLPTPSAVITVEGFSVFASMELDYYVRPVDKIVRFSGFGVSFACLDQSSWAHMGALPILNATDLPNITFDGKTWAPLGILAGDFFDAAVELGGHPNTLQVEIDISVLYQEQ